MTARGVLDRAARPVCRLDPDEVQQRMAPAFAVRVIDALTRGVATRIHDGVHLIGG